MSLKMHLGAAATRAYVGQVAEIATGLPAGADVEVAVLPTFPLLESTAAALAGTPVRWGAQDVAPSAEGAQTGEVSAGVLAELGCTYVEVGHAERRRLFGEDDAVVLAKTRQVVDAGLVPLVCVGEPGRGAATDAASVCEAQLEPLLAAAGGEVVVAYEPVWAIGAPAPAPASHVTGVCDRLRPLLAGRGVPARLLYGGSAGPGTWSALTPAVDGLFLGRFAHDTSALADVLAEVLRTPRTHKEPS